MHTLFANASALVTEWDDGGRIVLDASTPFEMASEPTGAAQAPSGLRAHLLEIEGSVHGG